LVIEYQNPSVQDFLVFYFRDFNDYVTDILNSTLYYNQFFKIFSYKDDFLFSITNRILLSQEQINIVVNKLTNEFDYLNSTVISRYSGYYKKQNSDIIKLNQIIKTINIDEYNELKDLLIKKFKEIMFLPKFEFHYEEIKSYVNLIQEFQFDIDYDAVQIINHIAENIIDINDFEEFEKLEDTFGPIYLEVTSKEYKHRTRIKTLLEIETENVDDDYLDDTLAVIIARAEKYKIDYTGFKKTIETKIEDKKNNLKNSYDWESENTKKPKTQNDVDNETIKDLFDSLRTEEKTAANNGFCASVA